MTDIMALFQMMLEYTGIFLLLFLFVMVLINLVTKGFIFKYLKVKAGRGKKQLVEALLPTGYQYFVGETIDGYLSYKMQNKTINKISVKPGYFHRKLGVDVLCIDEINNIVFLPGNKYTPAHDTKHTDGYIKRAIELGSRKDQLLIIIIIILIIMTGMICFCIYLINGMPARIVPQVVDILHNTTQVIR